MQIQKKHWQTAKDCLKYTSSIVKDSIYSSQNTFLKKKRPKMLGDKIILLHFYVSLSHILLCTKKNFSTKFFCFLFFSHNMLFHKILVYLNKKRFIINLLSLRCLNKCFVNFCCQSFCLTNYLVTKHWLQFFSSSQYIFFKQLLSTNLVSKKTSTHFLNLIFCVVFVCLFVCPSVPLQISHFRRSNKVLVKSPSTCFGE